MKTPKVSDRRLSPRPASAVRVLSFRGQMPYLGLLAMTIKGLKGSTQKIFVDTAAWNKLNTLSPKMIELFRGLNAFLSSHYFEELGLKVYRAEKNNVLRALYVMGEPENLVLIDRFSKPNIDEPGLSLRKHSNLIDDRHNS